MRNVLIVDGAANATFSVFQMTETEFGLSFPQPGQDIAFIEDVIGALGDEAAARMLKPVWERPIPRSEALGIHGLLIFEGEARRPFYPASGREMDFDEAALNPAQRDLFRRRRAGP